MRMRSLTFLASCLLLFASAEAVAAQYAFGGRTLEIPDPQGYVPAGRDVPWLIEVSQAYLPASNRLAEVYLPPADRDQLKGGAQMMLPRYFQLQVMREAEGVAVSGAEFTQLRSQIRSRVAPGASADNASVDEGIRRGNATMKEAGSDAEVSVSAPGFLGVFRDEPTGIFYSSTAELGVDKDGADTRVRVTNSTAIVLVDGQVLFLYAYAMGGDAATRQQTEAMASAWADAIRAANPGATPAPN